MEIKIEDLQKGDVILVATNSQLKAVKILRDLTLSKKLNWRGQTKYINTLCSYRKDIVPAPFTRTYTNGNGIIQTASYPHYEKIVYGLDENGHNTQSTIDLNYRTLYLIKKAELCH